MFKRRNQPSANTEATFAKAAADQQRDAQVPRYLESPRLRWVVQNLFGTPNRLFFFGVMFLAITQFLPHHPPALSEENYDILSVAYFFHELLRDLGIAFLVSVAISVAIEQFASDRREEEIEKKVSEVQQNALAAVFNTTLPSGWLEFVRSTLQNKKFYRTNMRVRYDIREPSTTEKGLSSVDFVICNVNLSYRVKNTSYSNDDYNIDCYVELPWEVELTTLPRLEAIIIDGKPIETSAIRASKVNKNWRFGIAYSHKVEIRGQDELQVEVRIRQVNYPRDTTTFTSIDPTDSLYVHLVAPEGYRTYMMLKHPMAGDHGEGLSAPAMDFGTLEGSNDPADSASHDLPLGARPTDVGSGAEADGTNPAQRAARSDIYTPDPCFPCTCVELSWSR